MKEPSAEWTSDERREVASAIAKKIKDGAAKSSFIVTCNQAESIVFVLEMSSHFLEENRKYVLHWIEFDTPEPDHQSES